MSKHGEESLTSQQWLLKMLRKEKSSPIDNSLPHQFISILPLNLQNIHQPKNLTNFCLSRRKQANKSSVIHSSRKERSLLSLSLSLSWSTLLMKLLISKNSKYITLRKCWPQNNCLELEPILWSGSTISPKNRWQFTTRSKILQKPPSSSSLVQQPLWMFGLRRTSNCSLMKPQRSSS